MNKILFVILAFFFFNSNSSAQYNKDSLRMLKNTNFIKKVGLFVKQINEPKITNLFSFFQTNYHLDTLKAKPAKDDKNIYFRLFFSNEKISNRKLSKGFRNEYYGGISLWGFHIYDEDPLFWNFVKFFHELSHINDFRKGIRENDYLNLEAEAVDIDRLLIRRSLEDSIPYVSFVRYAGAHLINDQVDEELFYVNDGKEMFGIECPMFAIDVLFTKAEGEIEDQNELIKKKRELVRINKRHIDLK